MLLVVCAAAYPQTKDLGLGAFANDKGPIMLAVGVSVVDRELTNPYLMFVIYMAAEKEGQDFIIGRKNVVMNYQGKEYKMPSLTDLRKNYKAKIRDINLYRHLGKEGIISSWIRFYRFPKRYDFFPALTMGAPLPVKEGYVDDFIGFRTKAYFKNPGLIASSQGDADLSVATRPLYAREAGRSGLQAPQYFFSPVSLLLASSSSERPGAESV